MTLVDLMSGTMMAVAHQFQRGSFWAPDSWKLESGATAQEA